ncbi:MAG: methylated-DNA--[protein]-cysteine S-methyltransferase [Flavobacteriales bacterium]|nr:methylated-DNA--[protein]-cysteine S-methyltransferase [Flavobacteriales bacterium]MEB2342252.1 methylated-DNA--[protein]-cysteine S-methyltransferase [Flavobacteriia bacterium]
MASRPTIQPELFKPQYLAALDTPVGKLWVESDGERITRVTFDNPGRGRNTRPPKALKEAVAQLKAYFAGRRKKFDLPLYLVGSPYRKSIWARLGKVPYGKAITYEELAADAGGAAHTAGAACAINPLLILVPCHRVIASDGLLSGYAGGLWRKKWLLEHEGVLRD